MTGKSYPFHHRSEVDVDADAHGLFAHLDDHRRLAGLWLGLLFGRAYAAWCTRRMTTDAVAARKS
jgi:hypothetical protein